MILVYLAPSRILQISLYQRAPKAEVCLLNCAPEPADDEDDAVVFEAAPRTLDVCALPIAKGNCRASKIRYGMVFTKYDLIISI